MKIKRLHKFIAITLCVTLLTISASRVTRVSAVGTTIAAAAGASLCAVGIIYCSYMALTGASMHVPSSVENITSWLTDMGEKVVQYPSGRAAYEELYPEFIGIGDEPLTSMLDRAWTWTADKIKSWANDFSSTDVISNIASYTDHIDSSAPAVQFDFSDYSLYYGATYWNETTNFPSSGIVPYSGARIAVDYTMTGSPNDVLIVTNTTYTNVRNVLTSHGMYRGQYWDGTAWVNNISWPYGGTYNDIYFGPGWYNNAVSDYSYYQQFVWNFGVVEYPPFIDADIYDEVTGEITRAIPQNNVLERRPQWPTLPPEDDNKPVIPYVESPFDPSWVDPVTGSPGGGNWGFNLARLLDALEDLSGLLVEIGTIATLINEFKNLLSGTPEDSYYIYYDDSVNNEYFYNYYTVTNYNGDVYQYDIDVSEADEHLPVDLNTISTYTNNRYLDEVKRSAQAGGSIIRDLVVFWYDVDPLIIYIFFGSCIAILVAAFIGKWGHS